MGSHLDARGACRQWIKCDMISGRRSAGKMPLFAPWLERALRRPKHAAGSIVKDDVQMRWIVDDSTEPLHGIPSHFQSTSFAFQPDLHDPNRR